MKNGTLWCDNMDPLCCVSWVMEHCDSRLWYCDGTARHCVGTVGCCGWTEDYSDCPRTKVIRKRSIVMAYWNFVMEEGTMAREPCDGSVEGSGALWLRRSIDMGQFLLWWHIGHFDWMARHCDRTVRHCDGITEDDNDTGTLWWSKGELEWCSGALWWDSGALCGSVGYWDWKMGHYLEIMGHCDGPLGNMMGQWAILMEE